MSSLVSPIPTSVDTYRLINEVFLVGDDLDRQILAAYSLTVRQYHLLNWLSRRGQASMTELAQLLLCDKSNVTGIVRRLKQARLIEELPKSDRRFTTVKLTPDGTATHRQAQHALDESIINRFARITSSQHYELGKLLSHVHDVLKEFRDQPYLREISGEVAVSDRS